MDAMITSAPRTEHTGDRVRVIADVSGRAPLWFAVDEVHAPLLGDRADHVAIGLLMTAMKEGRDLHVGGTMTDSLLHQMNGDLQRLLALVHPGLHRIRVAADETAPPAAPAPGVAAGFSGGVDSFATLAEYHWADDVAPSLRLTHLLNNSVGAHGRDGDALWRARCAPLARAAAEIGLPFLTVDSNLDEHYPRIGFIQSVTMRNATVPHLLGAGIGRLHLSSAVAFPDVRLDEKIEIINVMLVPLLSTTAVTIGSAGSGLTRVEKTLALVGRPEARYLDVCTDDDPERVRNCSACPKCVRTMLTLEMAGHLHEFVPATFALEPYFAHRDAYIAKALVSDDAFDREIREYAARIGWHWTASDRARSVVARARAAGAQLRRAASRNPVARAAWRALHR
ncbi:MULTISPECIES: hypothetical protein [Microbacterium]|uniref:hypothetical protein n=1 Tax=Microbacterium TaxID=33882 RepID=UPI00217E3EE8|nr:MULTISPECIES: hypothetical protein [Microbacterium]UWF77887.1 hypothetical protein JSY13_02150 [Microbacterium neungamense]WCM56064.1 hypothetical protein JRG78_02195 [Microbacterium sp. EF45047]